MGLLIFFWWIQLLCLASNLGYGSRLDRYRNSSKCKADERESWSYRGKNGPAFWGDRYPTCNGYRQSPIAIDSHKVVPNDRLPRLNMDNYDIPISRATMENNGHTIEVTPSDGVERTIYVNGDIYRLMQLHFHWGDSKSRGAEHTVDGVQHAMEMHLVHQNARNETAVVGVFFKEQSRGNDQLRSMIQQFSEVQYKDMRTEMNSKITLNNLIPANPSTFFRYEGSLTTPDCAEGVTWSVLTKPLPVSKEQMKQFRKLYSATKSEATRKCRISDNYRPIQPLNDRTVYLSL